MVNHHSVKRSDYILQKNIELQLKSEMEKNSKQSSLIIINGITDVVNIIHSLIKGDGGFYENKYSFTQLTDFWLLSFFSKKYFENRFKATTQIMPKKTEDPQLSLLSEIYESKRSFKSLWKRIYNYRSFILDLGKAIKESTIKDKLQALNFESHTNFSDEIDRAKAFRLKEMRQILLKIDESEKGEDEILRQLGKIAIETLKTNSPSWCRKIEDIANKEAEKLGILILVVKTNISDGLKNLNLVDNKDGNTIYRFDEMSSLPETLRIEAENAMKFFVYYKISNNNTNTDEKNVNFIREIIKQSVV